MIQSDGCKVLVVEDSAAFRHAVAAFVRDRWPMVKVLEAPDLAEARRTIREHAPSVVFLDVELPDGLGLDLLPAIRHAAPSTTVVVCTSHEGEALRRAALSRGVQAYLNKRQMDWSQVDRAVAAASAGLPFGTSKG